MALRQVFIALRLLEFNLGQSKNTRQKFHRKSEYVIQLLSLKHIIAFSFKRVFELLILTRASLILNKSICPSRLAQVNTEESEETDRR